MKYLKKYKIFERFDSDDFIRSLDSDWVTEYHNDIHGEKMAGGDFDDMKYYVNPWNYIDDDKFVEEWIDGEVEHYTSDFQYTSYDDSDLIEYLEGINSENSIEDEIYKKYAEEYIGVDLDNTDELEDYAEEIKDTKEQTEREGADWMLQDLSNDILKSLVEDEGDICDFVREVLNDRYRNSSARDICSEFHGENELDGVDTSFWVDNFYNIKWYLDEQEMAKDMPDWDYDDIVGRLDAPDDNFLEAIFKKYPEKSLDMVIYEVIGSELGDTYEFQKEYFDMCLVEDETETLEYDRINDLDKLGITIDDDIIKEFDIEHIIDAKEIGLL